MFTLTHIYPPTCVLCPSASVVIEDAAVVVEAITGSTPEVTARTFSKPGWGVKIQVSVELRDR